MYVCVYVCNVCNVCNVCAKHNAICPCHTCRFPIRDISGPTDRALEPLCSQKRRHPLSASQWQRSLGDDQGIRSWSTWSGGRPSPRRPRRSSPTSTSWRWEVNLNYYQLALGSCTLTFGLSHYFLFFVYYQVALEVDVTLYQPELGSALYQLELGRFVPAWAGTFCTSTRWEVTFFLYQSYWEVCVWLHGPTTKDLAYDDGSRYGIFSSTVYGRLQSWTWRWWATFGWSWSTWFSWWRAWHSTEISTKNGDFSHCIRWGPKWPKKTCWL